MPIMIENNYKVRKNDKLVFQFVFLFAILMPPFHAKFGSSGAIIVNGILLVALSLILSVSLSNKSYVYSGVEKRNLLIYFTPLLILQFLIPISMTTGLVFGGVNLIQRDFYELYKPLLCILVLTFSITFFSKNESIVALEKLLLLIFFLVSLIGINQLFSFSDIVSMSYTKAHNISSRRISAPFVNPYDYAFFITFFVYYFFSKVIFVSFRYIPLFLASIVMLILPQSRSVAVGFLIGFFVIMPIVLFYLGFKGHTLRISKKLMIFFGLFLFVLLFFIFSIPFLLDNFSYLTGQFVRLIDRGEVGSSAGIRLQQFLFAIDKGVNQPLILIFGNGPAKDEMEYVESIYNYLLYRYGLVGTFSYFFLIVIASYQSLRVCKKIGENHKYYSLFLCVFLWLISIPLLSVGNNFTEQLRLSYFYYMLLGLVAASYYRFVLKGNRS
ncbi:hypothetical protein BGL48_15715 [Salinivibrio sp. SS3]|uniref:hypothetical protein n=1 Tax=Salinivibrio sp. SS3 TaxID=1895021 RepID=UPI00086AB316|nr:hypothetical protein [Salinivibrio sp. BNH]ODP96831.1 hypothetical protein BGL48_15715 [Salinivibrio sp. BNH]